MKIGTVELRTDAVPLSMCFSPQEMSQNGRTLLPMAIMETLARSDGLQRSGKRRTSMNAATATVPKNSRPATTSMGET